MMDSVFRKPDKEWTPIMWAVAYNRGYFGKPGVNAKMEMRLLKTEHPRKYKNLNVDEVLRIAEELRFCERLMKEGII